MPYKRRSRKRSNKNFVAIPFTQTLSLGTLADNTVAINTLLSNLVEDLFVISVDAYWSLRGMTANEGPLEVGLAHGDYTVTEIKECIESDNSDPDDLIDVERSRRKVRRSGMFQVIAPTEVLAQGEKIRTRMKFTIGDGKSLISWISNRTGSALTTGGSLVVSGTIFGRWLR